MEGHLTDNAIKAIHSQYNQSIFGWISNSVVEIDSTSKKGFIKNKIKGKLNSNALCNSIK